MHSTIGFIGSGKFGEVFVPPSSERDARAALLSPGGGDSYLVAQDHRFALLNRVDLAVQAIAVATAEAVKLERGLRRIERKLAWTAATIMAPNPVARVGGFDILLAAGLSGIAALGMIVSNVVLSTYVLESASTLFGNDRIGAALFATLPCLGAVGLKVFESRLVNSTGRRLYGAVIFGLGIASLAVWMLAAAITFAPNAGGTVDLLTSPRSDNASGIVLVLTTIICEVTLGALILSGVGGLLAAKRASRAVSNPEHRALLGEKLRLEASLVKCRKLRIDAEDYLKRAAAGRELTRREAEHDVARARELWAKAQSGALAYATAVFLSTEKESR